jgi:hypothetical protein
MTDVPFPLLSAPGRAPQAAGGRLINSFPETLPATAGKQYVFWRVPGLRPWGVSGGANYRGSLVVGGLLYALIDHTVYTFPAIGGVGTALSGSVPGTAPVFWARNNAATPDVVVVSPGDGAFIVPTTGVAAYPGSIGQPNSVVYHRGFFIFTYGNAKTQASGVDSTSINTLDNATAQSKPDTLYRPIPLGNGQLLLCGDASIEVWGGDPNVGVAGYPFVYISTIARGIIGPNAIAGNDDGFGKGIFLVGDDFRVSRLDGYQPVPISTPEIDLLIENDPNQTAIQVSVHVAMGHGFVTVKGTGWCFEFDTTLSTWHERNSYLKNYWRGSFPVKFLNQWVCGDTDSGNLSVIDGTVMTEFGTNAVQTLSSSGTPTGGSFTLNFGGQVTTAIPFNASAFQVQAALQALPLIGAGNVICTGGSLPTAITMTFVEALSAKPISNMIVANSLTGGSSPAISIASSVTGVIGNPLRMRIETGPFGAFPAPVRINGIELYITKGAGIALGLDPLQTDPAVEISISRDGGEVWSSPRIVKVGQQALTNKRVRAAIWGQAEVQGVRWRFDMSAPVQFGFMGADMQSDTLR